jgi:hypothetical protein
MNAAPINKLSAQMAYGRAQWARLHLTVAARCAGGPAGRVLLHLLCACGDHQFRWHLQGIARELVEQVALLN